MIQKQHLPLIIGFSLPILLIVFIFFSVYLPKLLEHPRYDFIYSINSIPFNSSYYIKDSRIFYGTPESQDPFLNRYEQPSIFLYDIQHHQIHQLSLEEAQTYYLDQSKISPDGFSVEEKYQRTNFFPFFMSDVTNENIYLIKKLYAQRLSIQTEDSYNHAFHFIGWVVRK